MCEYPALRAYLRGVSWRLLTLRREHRQAIVAELEDHLLACAAENGPLSAESVASELRRHSPPGDMARRLRQGHPVAGPWVTGIATLGLGLAWLSLPNTDTLWLANFAGLAWLLLALGGGLLLGAQGLWAGVPGGLLRLAGLTQLTEISASGAEVGLFASGYLALTLVGMLLAWLPARLVRAVRD